MICPKHNYTHELDDKCPAVVLAESGRKMLTITINRAPLSVNAAWQGRRFSTPAKKQYEAAMRYLLPKVPVPGPYYRVEYDFYLKNFALTDGANLEKVLTDCIVKRGIIKDDRYILEYRIRKFKAADDKIVVRIEGCELDAVTSPQ